MDKEQLIEQVLVLVGQHLTQLRIDSTTPNDKGVSKGLTATDSQTIERYGKLLLAMTKGSDIEDNKLAGLSDEELHNIINGEQDVQNETSES